jgi:BRCA1-associated protein
MICGHIGCGRYQEAHAYDHYMATGHLFALEIDTQRIWDYVGDGYVHRLIQNTVDGGLVELPSSSSSQPVTTKKQWTTEGSSQQQQQQQQQQPQQHQQQSRDQGKLDIMSADYSYMLTSQLDSQRMYYEEQLEALTKELANASTQVKTVVNEIEMAKTQRLALLEKGKKLDSVMMDMRREKEKAEKKLMTYREKWGELQKGLKEEKVVNSNTHMMFV